MLTSCCLLLIFVGLVMWSVEYLTDEFAPYLEWAVWIDGCKVCEEVVFYRFYGYFRCIDTMVVRFYELDVCLVVLDVGSDGAGAFVVQYVKGWLVPVDFKFFVN